MPERWHSELQKLRSLSPPEVVPTPNRSSGVVGPSTRQRAMAAVVALVVFAVAGAFAWGALNMAPTAELSAPPPPVSAHLHPFPLVGRIACSHGTRVLDGVIAPQR